MVWLYRTLGRLGYVPPVVDEMYLWQCGAVMGVGGHEPIIPGSRSLKVPSDDAKPSGRGRTRQPEGFIGPDPSIQARLDRAVAKRAERALAEDYARAAAATGTNPPPDDGDAIGLRRG